ncbi:hypothetical protein D3C86_1829680 [compost metagenome]
MSSCRNVISPNGFSVNKVIETHHSIAFFSPLGILKTYSDVQIIIPSAFSISFLKFKIALRVSGIERSVSKCRSDFSSLKIFRLKISFVKFAKMDEFLIG